MPPWVSFLLIVFGIFVAPYVIGIWLANVLRMKDYAWKIAVVLGAVAVASGIVWFGWPPQYGPDLNGGVIMVYEVDSEKLKDDQSVDMAELAGSIRMRLDPSGIKEITVRPYGQMQIEIIVPQASSDGGDEATREEEARIRNIITDIGSLEFRIVANRRDSRHQSAIELGDQLPRAIDEVVNIDNKAIAKFVPISEEEVERFSSPDYVTRTGRDGKTKEILVIVDRYNVTGEYLNSARPGYDDRMRPSVNFTFNNVGAHYFNLLTSDNLPDQVGGLERQLAIILDGELFSAPSIQGVISDTGQITGSFTEEEVQHLSSILNAGKLPAALRKEPLSSNRTGPTLGRDTIEKGRIAMGFSLLAVMAIMVIYYRFSGMVSCVVLVSNLVLILALMIMFKAALTLAGIAGLVLGVGMAVDANVLIFERIREELDRGAALRMAIRNGFDRATRTIVDANLTTLITAIVLYVIGTDSVKGFAVTLILGLLMNLFTAVFCARVFFDIAERKRWITKLNMMRLLDKTEIDFIGISRFAMVGSVLLIALGIAAVAIRGRSLLDIDFTGGVSVQAQFNSTQEIEAVRKTVEQSESLPDVIVSELELENSDEKGRQFVINTSQQDVGTVESALFELFGPDLTTNDVTIAELEAIPGDATEESNDGPDADEEPTSSLLRGSTNALSALLNPQAGAVALGGALFLQEENETSTEPAEGESNEDAAPAEDTTSTDDAAPSEDAPVTGSDGEVAAPDSLDAGDEAAEADTEAQMQSVEEIEADLSRLFPGGSKASITLSRPLSFSSLDSAFGEVFRGDVRYDLFTPENVGLDESSEQPYSNWTVFVAMPPAEAKQFLDKVTQLVESQPYFPSSNKIGGRVAGGMREQAIVALIASQLFIILYIWIRFQRVIFGLAAVVAVIHDVLITLGIVALSLWLAGPLGYLLIDPFKISLATVAAFLTLVGYSLNDTIVVFDRIREVRGKDPKITSEMINSSINQTLGRTILTSLTTIIVLVILFVRGGTGIHAFTFVMLVGVVVGTYSSMFIASPVLLWLVKPSLRTATSVPQRAKQPAA